MVERRLVPTKEEKKIAGKVLSEIFNSGNDRDAAKFLREHLEDRSPGLESILATNIDEAAREIENSKLPQVLVNMFGTEIFEGSMGIKLRDEILNKLLATERYDDIHSIYHSAINVSEEEHDGIKRAFFEDRVTESKKYHRKLMDHRAHSWRPGRRYAREFVRALRISSIFSGLPSDPRPSRTEEVIPISEIKPLKNFQLNMRAQVLQILQSRGGRAIVSLPTGSGKTRMVVEAAVALLNQSGPDKNILWIADTQEVCEQAVVCFKQIWERYGKGGILNIYRTWGDNDLPVYDEHGIIVASIQKLSASSEKLDSLRENLSTIIIDEAHHSIAPSYVEVLEHLGLSRSGSETENDSRIPLIGLSATPERKEPGGTRKLHNMYRNNTVYPCQKFSPSAERGVSFDDNWQNMDYMRKKLTQWKYLADAEFVSIGVGDVKLDMENSAYLKRGNDKWMRGVAIMAERNRLIKDYVLKEARNNKKILYFGPNVSQSNAMARILEEEDVGSVCITSETRHSVRKMFVDIFNGPDDSKIQVMCNYNVLSTGFDSPKIDMVVIARPTTSVVAYQQMVGRGLRGEEFGGREGNRCTIVTVEDNIFMYNNDAVKLGYQEFREYHGI
ncbi:superfamily II helicase [Cenarchaeum symbiosum A]|uniref:Superfamily II helicase n=1 Tax=Cenarchaeum symbiosum (strain A) TaxID=414004 RepID=A0RY27_CENSY|nr:superfamily II helicase [Cenarchaeum symbiosum A]